MLKNSIKLTTSSKALCIFPPFTWQNHYDTEILLTRNQSRLLWSLYFQEEIHEIHIQHFTVNVYLHKTGEKQKYVVNT